MRKHVIIATIKSVAFKGICNQFIYDFLIFKRYISLFVKDMPAFLTFEDVLEAEILQTEFSPLQKTNYYSPAYLGK
jgi:hypothetical protein